jgi:hypothetical protein
VPPLNARRRLHAPCVPVCWLALALCCWVASGCGGKIARGPHQEQARANSTALEQLRFGMSRDEAAAVMGTQEIVPPWANELGIGPQILSNPIDSGEFESPSGEVYEVDRYAVGLYGQSGCPFVRGEARLAPLIYLDGKLVGWRWSYLESVLQRSLVAEEQSWSFGQFCGQASEIPD